VFAVAGKVVMGTILAELLNKQLIGRQILRGLFLLPWVIPTFITAYTWQWLLNDFGGIINVFFEAIPGITNSPSWLSDPSWAMPTVIAVNVWRGTPFIAIPLLAGMQGIPKDLYESAAVDGASGLQKFFHITVPSLRSVYTVITLLTAIFTLNDFELVYILTRGGPVNSTKIFSILSYEYAFASNDLGLGTAVSLLFAPLVLILMILALKYIYKGGGEV
jgi:multiple sugar transport system permease protein